MKLTTNIVIAVSGLSMLLLSNHGADASTLRKPRGATEDIKKISEKINTKQSPEVSLKKKHKVDTTKNIRGDDKLTAIIESEECDVFTESLSDKAAGFILDIDESTIIEDACNAIQRKQIAQFGEQIADRDIARHKKKGSLTTCESAYEMKLSEAISNMIERTSSYEGCKKEMKSELEYVQRAESRGELKKVISDLVVVGPSAIIGIILLISYNVWFLMLISTPAY